MTWVQSPGPHKPCGTAKKKESSRESTTTLNRKEIFPSLSKFHPWAAVWGLGFWSDPICQLVRSLVSSWSLGSPPWASRSSLVKWGWENPACPPHRENHELTPHPTSRKAGGRGGWNTVPEADLQKSRRRVSWRTVNPQDIETSFPAPASSSPAIISGTCSSSQTEDPAPHLFSVPGGQMRLCED